jgi:ribonuclease HI
MTVWSLYIDGASRNNPGRAGAGVYLLKDGQPFLKRGYFLGIKTNNQAEYYSLALGCFLLAPHRTIHDELSIFSDSQLMVRQLLGEYKVKDRTLQSLFNCAKIFLTTIRYRICHITRKENSIADRLANYGIDKEIVLPEAFKSFCRIEERPV